MLPYHSHRFGNPHTLTRANQPNEWRYRVSTRIKNSTLIYNSCFWHWQSMIWVSLKTFYVLSSFRNLLKISPIAGCRQRFISLLLPLVQRGALDYIFGSQMFSRASVQSRAHSPFPARSDGGYKINLLWSLKSVHHSDKTRFLELWVH